ncbi:MAG: cobyrinate a,c-diamide synthase [Pseudomonadota bacterium]
MTTTDKMNSHGTPGLMLAAATSGAGKTTLTLGVARAISKRGYKLQTFKCGPDYIDPAFHQVACGRQSYNLDSWSMSQGMLAAQLDHAVCADFALAEGAMGLFDGVAHRGATGNGSSADIAALTGWPVILVVDCTAQAQTAAAVALGLSRFRDDVNVAGVILNKVAGQRHFDLVRDGFQRTDLTLLGWLPRANDIQMPERHLGLVQARESEGLEGAIEAAAELVEQHIDLDRLIALARPLSHAAAATTTCQPPGQRIALARDDAFSFIYPHMIGDWCAAGADIVPFSPLADEPPDQYADVVWLPGGYPELHAGRLAAATTFVDGLRKFAQSRPVHGECGGYMVLGKALIDGDGTSHQMAGLLGLVTSFAKRRLHLGYRAATLRSPIPGHGSGTTLRGHEFHYSSIIEQPDDPLADVTDAAGRQVMEQGSRRGSVTGTFFHLVAPDAGQNLADCDARPVAPAAMDLSAT